MRWAIVEPQNNRPPFARISKHERGPPSAHIGLVVPKHARYQAALRPDGVANHTGWLLGSPGTGRVVAASHDRRRAGAGRLMEPSGAV